MTAQPGFIRPVFLLQVEALCLFLASLVAYHLLFPHHWALFACLFLVPDLSLLTYLGGPGAAAGAAASVSYNAFHNYALPLLLAVLAAWLRSTLAGQISLIWIAHISMDRMLGYGLKYPASFKFTHIQSTADPVIEPLAANATHR